MLHHLFVDGFIFDTDFCVAFYSAYFGFCNYYWLLFYMITTGSGLGTLQVLSCLITVGVYTPHVISKASATTLTNSFINLIRESGSQGVSQSVSQALFFFNILEIRLDKYIYIYIYIYFPSSSKRKIEHSFSISHIRCLQRMCILNTCCIIDIYLHDKILI